MSQEETKENLNSDESATDSSQTNLNLEENATDLSQLVNSEESDNLPIESIGSYGRIEPLVNDDTQYPEETNAER